MSQAVEELPPHESQLTSTPTSNQESQGSPRGGVRKEDICGDLGYIEKANVHSMGIPTGSPPAEVYPGCSSQGCHLQGAGGVLIPEPRPRFASHMARRIAAPPQVSGHYQSLAVGPGSPVLPRSTLTPSIQGPAIRAGQGIHSSVNGLPRSPGSDHCAHTDTPPMRWLPNSAPHPHGLAPEASRGPGLGT
ncbi:uncharacterized protein AKAME5_002059700 [Lates japonicus]|uniref:Uncharacterized protein n=1 Tax=Lates japonicus TaxID=270547 RepID=A0AAD3RG65_LATJO|nr:uncharacterized protein AKAME5_002059700 [Lates japonicus]